jgi:hypothetical protein
MAPSSRWTWMVTVIAGAAAFQGGCARPGALPGPEDTVRRYVDAVRADDAQAAYDLLDPATRAEVPFDRFAAAMRENRPELLDQAAALEEALAQREVRPRARARLPGGESVTLVEEADGWRVESGVAQLPVLETPRDAVLALRRALLRRSLPDVQRVLSRATRDELEADIQRLLDETADELDLEYEVEGDQAQVRTSGGRQIHLIREAGEWRVVDVQDPQQ